MMLCQGVDGLENGVFGTLTQKPLILVWMFLKMGSPAPVRHACNHPLGVDGPKMGAPARRIDDIFVCDPCVTGSKNFAAIKIWTCEFDWTLRVFLLIGDKNWSRALKWKLVVPRTEEGQQYRDALWTTHDAINAATKNEELLLLMRQEHILYRDETIKSAEEVTAELDDKIDEILADNGAAPLDDEDRSEARALLRRIYEAIVPSAIGETGNAQNAGAFVGPLFDANSDGFMNIFTKIENPPNWFGDIEALNNQILENANKWISTPGGQQVLDETRAAAKWKKAYLEAKSNWPELFYGALKDQDNAPEWCKMFDENQRAVFNQTELWLETKDAQTRLAATGAPAKWMKAANAREINWPFLFMKTSNRNKKRPKGHPRISKDYASWACCQ